MKYLKIKNKGKLDFRLIALMGGTTKSNQEYKIGQFGTGLKYTLAFLIRNNVDFKIFVGQEEVKITTEHEEIQGIDFNVISINGVRTSITDKMGLEWTAWMILRELWCNALDEGDNQKEIVESDDLKGYEDSTVFYIQVTSEVKEVLDNWNKYFIHDTEPMFESEHYAIYPGGETLRIYKQGVLIEEIEGKNALFSYDIKNASINELREFKGNVQYSIFKALQNTNEKVITYFLENCKENVHYEATETDYNWYESFGNIWKETLGSAKIIHQKAVDTIKSKGLEIDTAGLLVVPKKVYDILSKQFEGVGALRTSKKINEFYESFNPKLEAQMKKGLVILESLDYDFSPEIKFVYGVFGDKNICAQINCDTKEVFISDNMLAKPLFEVVAMLIEENEHLRTGFSDHTREFQQHFINLYTKTLLTTKNIEL